MTAYKKHFIPLESNPDVFNDLMYGLGVPQTFSFQDVFTLDEPELLPHPTLALILIFPTSDSYESQKAKQEASDNEYDGSIDGKITWFKQTINNACGLYAILHAVCNTAAKDSIRTPQHVRVICQCSSVPRARFSACKAS